MVNQKFARRPLATTALKGLDKGLQRLELSLPNDGYANQLLSFLETLLFFLFSGVDEDGSWWKCRAMKGCEEGKVCVRERTERSGQHRLWSCETGGSVACTSTSDKGQVGEEGGSNALAVHKGK